MLVLVTAVTYYTNLAVAVLSGVILSSLGFAWKQATRGVVASRDIEMFAYDGQPATVYKVRGPLFFGSVTAFKDLLSAPEDAETDDVVLDFMEARVWDSSALEAVSDVSARFEAAGKRAHLRHLSPDCARLLEQADDLVEIDTLEDPTYGVATDYPKSAIQ